MPEQASPISKLVLAVHLVGAGTLAFAVYHLSGFYHDDAFITLRYARNWLDGLGPVWNGGEIVQGYTNFLHLLLITLLGKAGMDLMTASRFIGIVSYALLLWTMARAVKLTPGLHHEDALPSVLCHWLVAASVPLIGWAFGGLETLLAAALLLAAVTHTLKACEQEKPFKALLAGGLFALAMLARPDMGLFAAISGVYVLCHALRARNVMLVAAFALALLAIQLPYTYWRVQFYGDWLPNTYWVKLWGIPREWLLMSGVFYLLQLFLMFPMLAPMVLGLAGWMVIGRRLEIRSAYLLVMVLTGWGYLVWAGGDHMSYMRFAAPLVPLMVLFMYHALLALREAGHGKWVRDVAGAMLLFLPAQVGYVQGTSLSSGALSGMAVAEYAAKHFPAGSLVAINPAGALPYLTPDIRYLDMLGLNDAAIARREITELVAPSQGTVGHMKGDGEYVLSRQPDVVIFGMNWGTPIDQPMFLSDLELSQSEAFRADYEPVEAWVDVPAFLAPQLQRMAQDANQRKIYHLQLNPQGQLRFLYFRRKTETP